MLLGTPLGNTLRTWWEPIGNLKGTCWEQRKNEKKSLFPPTQNLKGKIKSRHFAEPSHWLHEKTFLFSKLLVTIFWPGLIPPLFIVNWRDLLPFACKLSTICQNLGETRLCYFKALYQAKFLVGFVGFSL